MFKKDELGDAVVIMVDIDRTCFECLERYGCFIISLPRKELIPMGSEVVPRFDDQELGPALIVGVQEYQDETQDLYIVVDKNQLDLGLPGLPNPPRN